MKNSVFPFLFALTALLASCGGSDIEWFPSNKKPVITATISGQTIFNNVSTTVSSLPANVIFSADTPTTIYYTTDSTEPSTSSSTVDIPSANSAVTGPLISVANTVLKFFGIGKDSKIATSTVTSNIKSSSTADTTAPTVSAQISNSTSGGAISSAFTNRTTHVSALPVSITFSASEATTIYYTTNGNTPDTSSSVASISSSSTTLTITDLISVTNTVLKFFGIDSANNQSATLSGTVVSP